MVYQCKFTTHFVQFVCPHCQLEFLLKLKDLELRTYCLCCVCLTSVSYGHWDFRARWSWISFRQLSTLKSILQGLFPWEWKNKTKQNKTKKMLNIWIENLKVLFLRNSRELGFLCDCIIGVCSLNVLKNLFVMLLSLTHFFDCNHEAVEVNVMEICFKKSQSPMCWWIVMES